MIVRLFADYRQIHVCAERSKGDLADAWTAQATADRIAAAGDIVGIGTENVDDVDVTVDILREEPPLTKGDHVTEASIDLGDTLVVLGCTDYLPDAKRWKVPPGTWRIRATHKNLEKRERIRLQIWPAKTAKPRVLVRYKPPKKQTPIATTGKPKNRKQAVAAALRGEVDIALDVLLELHRKGDASASASAAEVLAFRGRTKEMIECAKALLAHPDAVYAGNVSDDMRALVSLEKKTKRNISSGKPERKRFDDAVKMATEGKRFKGKPKELAQHCFALATVFHVDDEIIARWDPKHPYLHFDQAADVARALVRRGDEERAWEILESRLSRWYPVDSAQVLPVVLLIDALLASLLTPERIELVLRTPRAVR